MTRLTRYAACLGIIALTVPFQPQLAAAREQMAPVAPPARDEAAYPPGTLGICHLAPLAGRVAVDSSGNLLVLSDYCRSQHDQLDAQAEQFWQRFVANANAETMTFARTLDRQSVVTYSTTICPFLENGGTLSELRQLQADNHLPVAFEVAITLAAIHTYCPAYRSEIGR
ncbi:MAG TPA: hypothetical protein V6D10_23600 [Trichocoleus sp.]|jgi:hypothetical protein